MARARVGRGERRARHARSSARCPRPVLARRLRTTGRSVRRRRVPRRRRQRVARADARRLVRGVVDEDAVARRATHHDARVTPRRRRSRHSSARGEPPRVPTRRRPVSSFPASACSPPGGEQLHETLAARRAGSRRRGPACGFRLAEGVGFEPTVTCATMVFETIRFGRSRIPPPGILPMAPFAPSAVGRRGQRRSAKNSRSSVADSSARTPPWTSNWWLRRGSAPRL